MGILDSQSLSQHTTALFRKDKRCLQITIGIIISIQKTKTRKQKTVLAREVTFCPFRKKKNMNTTWGHIHNLHSENRKCCWQQELQFPLRKQKMLLATRVIISTQKTENVAGNKSYNFHSENRKCCWQQEL